jgi:hypothetical protein
MVDQLDIYFRNDGIHEVRQQLATDNISTIIYVNHIPICSITRCPILPMATIS